MQQAALSTEAPGEHPRANAKYIYALDMWTVERRPSGWYFSNPPTTATSMTGAARIPASSASRS